MIKYFKDNNEYFKFINKKKDTCHISRVKILKHKILVEYEVIKNES